MREIISLFEKGLQVGLTPTKQLNTLAESCYGLYNLLPKPTGLEPRPDVLMPNFDIVSPYPFPILHQTSRYNYVFTERRLYELDNLETPIGKLLYEKDWTGRPHIADFQDTAVIATPAGIFLHTPTGMTQDVAGATATTCCNFKGQLIIGNCWLPPGPSETRCADAIPNIPVGGCDCVAWSRIGDVTDWEYTLGNEVGWVFMPYQGCVRKVLPLGDSAVMVYCDNGVVRLTPQSEPAVTFGMQDFGRVGILNRDAVDGWTTHLFIGVDRKLYLIQPQRALSQEGFSPKCLDYEWAIRDLQDPFVTYDAVRNEWWIGNEMKAYIYNGVGLAEVGTMPTKVNNLDGTVNGYVAFVEDDSAYIETSPVSFSRRGLCTIMNVEADLEAADNVRVWGWTRWEGEYNKGFPTNSPQILLDPRGSFFPIVSGSQHRICLQFDDFHEACLSKLYIHYKTTDKQFSRGNLNARSVTQQTD